jgi:hypothetical protein
MAMHPFGLPVNKPLARSLVAFLCSETIGRDLTRLTRRNSLIAFIKLLLVRGGASTLDQVMTIN